MANFLTHALLILACSMFHVPCFRSTVRFLCKNQEDKMLNMQDLRQCQAVWSRGGEHVYK